ncbi:MAG: cobalamin biosynthesis protein [Acidiferrobacterales bacterium]
MRVMLGVGCDRGTPLETLETAMEQALTLAGLGREAVCGLATIDRKNDEACVLMLAKNTHWPLHFFSAEELAQVPVPNPSATVLKYMGTPAVAEAAALLAAHAGLDALLVEKYKYRGKDGKNATVSIVRTDNEGK